MSRVQNVRSTKLDVKSLREQFSECDGQWQQRKRKVNTHHLCQVLLAKTHVRRVSRALRMIRSESRGGPGGTWESLFRLGDRDGGSSTQDGVSSASISKALRRLPSGAFRRINRSLFLSNASNRPLVLAVDGSKVRVPPHFAKHGFRSFLSSSSAPSSPLTSTLTALVDVHTKEPFDWIWTKHFDEWKAALELLQHVPRGSTILCDRGYFSAAFVRQVYDLGLQLVARIKRKPNKELGDLVQAMGPNTMKFVPHTSSIQRPVTLCRYDIGDQAYYCLIVSRGYGVLRRLSHGQAHRPGRRTRAESESAISAHDIRRLYHKRWQVETFFKTLKSTLKLTDVRTTHPTVFEHEIDVRCLGVSLLHSVKPPADNDCSAHHRPLFAWFDYFLLVLSVLLHDDG